MYICIHVHCTYMYINIWLYDICFNRTRVGHFESKRCPENRRSKEETWRIQTKNILYKHHKTSHSVNMHMHPLVPSEAIFIQYFIQNHGHGTVVDGTVCSFAGIGVKSDSGSIEANQGWRSGNISCSEESALRLTARPGGLEKEAFLCPPGSYCQLLLVVYENLCESRFSKKCLAGDLFANLGLTSPFCLPFLRTLDASECTPETKHAS